jgi:hypothetical protein
MGSKSKKTKRTESMPEWINSASQKAVGIGENIATREYTPFQGERVAGLSDNEMLASERARDGFGSANDYFNQGASALGGVQSWTQADHQAYMNPYIENVVNRQQRDVGRTFDRKRADLARTSGMRSAFGGGRQTMMEGDLSKNYLETAGDISEAGYSRAFDQAAQIFGDEQNRKIATAGAFGSLGASSGSMAGQEVDSLLRTGATERGVDQMGKDFDYLQFIESRDWDVNNLEPLLRAIQMAKHDKTTTETQKTSGGGLSALAGAAMVVGGVMTANPALITGGATVASSGGG